jgi:adenylate cyclase
MQVRHSDGRLVIIKNKRKKRNMEKKHKSMTRFQYLHKANDVLVGNLIAVFLGDWFTDILFKHRARDASESMLSLVQQVDEIFGLTACLFIILVTLVYERPIRACLKCFRNGRPCDPKVMAAARRRVLNEPFMIVILDSVVWGLGAFLFWLISGPGAPVIGIACGLITLVLAFFWVEHVIQHNLIPLFFPDGVLSNVPGVISLNLRMRFGALIFAVSVVPLTFIHITILRFREMQMMDEITLLTLVNRIQETIAVESIMFVLVGGVLSYLVMSNLKQPVEEIIRVMGQVKKGNFKETARVVTNDELGFAGETLNAMTAGLREREMIKDTFGRYVDKRIRDEILNGRIPLDGELKKATILFADLRNFTPLVAVTPPKQLIYMLNAYFNEMETSVKAHKGLILQFIGDEVEAVFGAPVHAPYHELAALKTALDMRFRLERLNHKFMEQGIRPIAHGVGIHTGPVLAANIGSAERSAYSLIGDTVNIASRIQGLTKEFKTDILVSSAVQAVLKTRYEFTAMPKAWVKGKPDPVQVYGLGE